MSWRDAPLYVEASDLARYVLDRAAGWTDAAGPLLAPAVTEAALALVDGVALALTFPETRPTHLDEADRAVVRLRERLRLACALGLLSGGALRHTAGRLTVIGRNIGGWRRRRGVRPREPPEPE